MGRGEDDTKAGLSEGAPLASSDERLRILSELAQGYSYTVTRLDSGEIRVDWITQNFEQTFHLHVGDRIRARTFARLLPPDERKRVLCWMAAVLDEPQQPLEHRALDHRGERLWVYHAAHAARVEGGIRIDGSALDVTERKQAEEVLAQSEERFRMMTDHMSDMIVELDDDRRIVFINRAVGPMLGWDPERALGFQFGPGTRGEDTIHREDILAARQRFDDALESVGRKDKVRSRYLHRDGSWRWVEMAGNSFRTPNGVHTLLVGREVTERVEREAADLLDAERLEREVQARTEVLEETYRQLQELRSRLADAEKLGAADELTGSLAHAINNPLGALTGRLQMELEAPVPSRSALIPIQRLGERIHSVVANTLALYREGRLRLADTRVADLFDDLRGELGDRAHRSNVRLEIRHDAAIPPLLVDRTLLAAALVSVAENGLEAMPSGGVLDIEARHIRASAIVQFRIADQGSGISDQARARIFDAFFTTKSSGTGLGLPIANGVVRGHRGRIDVERRREGGTIFCISIPYGELREEHELAAAAV